jgi:hypothetical protein
LFVRRRSERVIVRAEVIFRDVDQARLKARSIAD